MSFVDHYLRYYYPNSSLPAKNVKLLMVSSKAINQGG